MISNIKNNTISDVATKNKINKLNEIKNVETKGKRLINGHEKLLSFFGDLKTIFNNNNSGNNSNNNESDSNNKNENKNENVNENENEKESDSEQNYQIEQIILKRLMKQNHLKIK